MSNDLKTSQFEYTAPSLSMNPKTQPHCSVCGRTDELAMHRCKNVEHSNEWNERKALHRECNWISS